MFKKKFKKKPIGSRLFSGFAAALMAVTLMAATGITSGAANTTDVGGGLIV